jgi:hypothetical protein
VHYTLSNMKPIDDTYDELKSFYDDTFNKNKDSFETSNDEATNMCRRYDFIHP